MYLLVAININWFNEILYFFKENIRCCWGFYFQKQYRQSLHNVKNQNLLIWVATANLDVGSLYTSEMFGFRMKCYLNQINREVYKNIILPSLHMIQFSLTTFASA